MDIGAAGIVSWIASSTNSSFVTYEPIFLLIGGLVLALMVMGVLISLFTGGGNGGIDSMDLDDSMEI